MARFQRSDATAPQGKTKKPKKRIEGQRETLLPITCRDAVKEAAKKPVKAG